MVINYGESLWPGPSLMPGEKDMGDNKTSPTYTLRGRVGR